jgi:hypothetical protein
MSDVEWREENSGDARLLVALGPGGYRARIAVTQGDVSARLGRPQEERDSFVVTVQGLLDDEVAPTIERLKLKIEERFELLESGHS